MYKLVTQSEDGVMTTMNNTRWTVGVTNKARGAGETMCSDAVLHCYSHPLLAIMFNPLHANIENPVLLEIECSEIVNTDGLKHACKEQTPIAILQLPEITTTQKVAFGIKCALLFCEDDGFMSWANKWLTGEDRSSESADAAARANAPRANAALARAAYREAVALAGDFYAYAAAATDAAAYAGVYSGLDINSFFIATIEFVVANY